MESHKEDNGEDSKKTDWRMIFILFRSRGFTDEEICQLSYPKFKAYFDYINDPLFFGVMIPYLGSNEKEKSNSELISNSEKFSSREELFNMVASMNSGFN